VPLIPKCRGLGRAPAGPWLRELKLPIGQCEFESPLSSSLLGWLSSQVLLRPTSPLLFRNKRCVVGDGRENDREKRGEGEAKQNRQKERPAFWLFGLSVLLPMTLGHWRGSHEAYARCPHQATAGPCQAEKDVGAKGGEQLATSQLSWLINYLLDMLVWSRCDEAMRQTLMPYCPILHVQGGLRDTT
jgi:hypothetical protein